jgi:RNA polymerase sigma factor (sigma-70 family)
MSSAETMLLVQQAKRGDKAAWEGLCARYYDDWLRLLHGKLGKLLRTLHDTEDILQSALADALRDIPNLRNEAAFFSWVSAIARRKIADKSRRLKKAAIPQKLEAGDGGEQSAWLEHALEREETYIRTLDAMLELLPRYPDHMGALYLRYFEGVGAETIGQLFQRSERAAYALIEGALKLLRSVLIEPQA